MAKLPGAVAGARIVGEKFVHSRRGENPDGRMPLIDHLRELRNRVVKIAIAILAGAVLGYAFYQRIWSFMQRPFCQAVGGQCNLKINGHFLVYTGVMDPFYLRLKIAILAGAVLTSPFWLYQLWAFIAPGLYSREKRWTYSFLGTAVPLFGLGCYFANLAMYRGLRFFMDQQAIGTVNFYTADTYLSYWIMMIIGFGLCFEVPLFLVMLNLTRVITHERFKKWRRIIIFLIFVFAGIASPSPDPITMLLLGGVVAVLVEAAEVFIFLNDRRYARSHPDLYEDLDDRELAPLDDIDSSDTVS